MPFIGNGSWAVTNFFKDEDTVESDDLPLFLNLFLGKVAHPVLYHALKKLPVEFHVIGVFIGTWVLNLLIEILMEIDFFVEFNPVLFCNCDQRVEGHKIFINVEDGSRCHTLTDSVR